MDVHLMNKWTLTWDSLRWSDVKNFFNLGFMPKTAREKWIHNGLVRVMWGTAVMILIVFALFG